MTSYLNAENIARSRDGVEYHPLRPFLPENARVLFLGSFPPQRKRWCMDFYYPNYINDHWRIEGQVFFDTSTAIRRLQDNASDKYLEVVEPTDISALLRQLPHCRAVVTTGEKATETICAALGIADIPKVNNAVAVPEQYNRDGVQIILYRLPSSSRAYPLSFDRKVEAYRKMFVAVGFVQ